MLTIPIFLWKKIDLGAGQISKKVLKNNCGK